MFDNSVTATSGQGTTIWHNSGPYVTYTMTTPSSNEISVQTPSPMALAEEKMFEDSAKEKGTVGISPKLYMRFVKSKLNKMDTRKVQQRMSKLKKLISYADNMGQQAMYEELAKEIAVLMKESEMVACGVDAWVNRVHLNQYITKVRDRVVHLKKLEDFPRVIPKKVRDKLTKLKAANVFEEYWIVYIDYSGEKLQTTKEKVREKDPIIFGKLSYLPERYYFVADWVDKYCDLTLSKMVKEFKESDPEFELNKHPELTETRWKKIVDEVKSRGEILAKTKPSNYKEILKQMDDEPKATNKWWRFWT